MPDLKSSQEWWDEILMDGGKMVYWLKRQFHGETLAGARIREVFSKFDLTEEDKALVEKVASEEDLHARWIGELLDARGVPLDLLHHEERYWKHAYDNLDTVEDAAAVGFLAEEMRLSRIKVIAECERSPYDIKKVMARIYTQELGHVEIFKNLTDSEAIEAHLDNHNSGLNALGLVA